MSATSTSAPRMAVLFSDLDVSAVGPVVKDDSRNLTDIGRATHRIRSSAAAAGRGCSDRRGAIGRSAQWNAIPPPLPT